MSLPIEATVLGLAEVYSQHVSPTLTDSYAIEANRLSVMMLKIMGNAVDDAVALRVAEHAQLREILGEGASIIGDAELSARLREAAGSTDPGLRISELDGESERLRRLLIALQVALESRRDDDAARALDQRIWRLLVTFEQSRAPRL